MEQLAKIFTSPEFLSNIPNVLLLLLAIGLAAKFGLLRIKTDHVTIGDTRAASDKERAIIREQCDFTHAYLMGLVNKITATTVDGQLMYGGYFTKYILERAYDEFVKWITFNHISLDEAYVHTKQEKMKALVYSHAVRDEFKTEEFAERMDRWVREILEELVKIRQLYMKTRG